MSEAPKKETTHREVGNRPEVKAKISAALKAKWADPKHREKVALAILAGIHKKPTETA